MLRKLAVKLHRVIGLTIGIFVLVVSLTGSMLVFRGEIDRALNPDLLHVQPTGSRTSIDRAVEQARRALSGENIWIIRVPRRSTDPYEMWPVDVTAPHVFVNPYTGTILGTRHETESLMGFLFELHTKLLSGERGEKVMGTVGLLLVFLCVSGLVLWWPGVRKIKLALTVAWRRNWRRVTYDLHRAGGFWTLAFLLVTAVTGASLVFYEAAGHVLNWVTASNDSTPVPPPSVQHPGAEPISLDFALLNARSVLPQGEPTYLYPPLKPDAPITIRMRLPGELHPNGRSYVYLDQYTGRPSLVWNALEAGRGERILNTFYPLHIGQYGGLVVRILYVLLGLTPAVLAITGFMMWRARRNAPCRDLPASVEADLNRRRAALTIPPDVRPIRPVRSSEPADRL